MKVLIVGLGGIGQRHVRNLRTLLGSEVEILAYRVRKLPYVVTEQLGIEPESNVEEEYNIQVYGDFEQAIATKPDAVFICNPSSLHIPLALSAARAGSHLFIEKPLSHNLDGIEELIALVEQQNLTALVGYQMRFHPCLQHVQKLLQQKVIGQLLAVRVEFGEYLPGWHKYEDYRQMYASQKQLGGGVILSQIHDLDYIYWLFGMPKRIFALGGHLSSLEIDVEDIASTLMECMVEGKLIPIHLHQDYVQRPPSRTCQIVGDIGKILIDFQSLNVQVFDDQGKVTENITFEGFQRNQLFLDEMKHFLACIDGKETPLVTLRDGTQSLRMALAAKESLTTGNIIELTG